MKPQSKSPQKRVVDAKPKKDASPYMYSGLVSEEGRLIDFLRKSLPTVSLRNIKLLLKHGAVSLGRTPTTSANAILEKGQKVSVLTKRASEAGDSLKDAGIQILFEDEYLIAIDKPEGLRTSAPPGTEEKTAYKLLIEFIRERSPTSDLRVFPLHRLDQRTSGVLLFAKSYEIKEKLKEDWNKVNKIYRAVVEGTPSESHGTMRSFLADTETRKVVAGRKRPEAKEAVSKYKVLSSSSRYSHLEVTLETGRKNQIRVQLSELGHPIAGDRKYGAQTDPFKRLGLHAHKLEFAHPVTGKHVLVIARLPNSFESRPRN